MNLTKKETNHYLLRSIIPYDWHPTGQAVITMQITEMTKKLGLDFFKKVILYVRFGPLEARTGLSMGLK